MKPLFLNLEVALVETTCPVEEFPDASPKLFLLARCNGREFRTPFQSVDAVEGGRDALVGILFEVLGRKVVGSLDELNELTDRTPKRAGWVSVPSGSNPTYVTVSDEEAAASTIVLKGDDVLKLLDPKLVERMKGKL